MNVVFVYAGHHHYVTPPCPVKIPYIWQCLRTFWKYPLSFWQSLLILFADPALISVVSSFILAVSSFISVVSSHVFFFTVYYPELLFVL